MVQCTRGQWFWCCWGRDLRMSGSRRLSLHTAAHCRRGREVFRTARRGSRWLLEMAVRQVYAPTSRASLIAGIHPSATSRLRAGASKDG